MRLGAQRREEPVTEFVPVHYRNSLLQGLSPADLKTVQGFLELHLVARGQSMIAAHAIADYTYFPESGLGAVLGRIDGQVIDIGLFGRDGMSPFDVADNDEPASHDSQMQIPGYAWRASSKRLREAVLASPTLAASLCSYARDFYLQVAETSASTGICATSQRLARLLLLCADKTGSDELALTHADLAMMLSVQRPSITLALQDLEGDGAIHSYRGRIVIRHRGKLTEAT
jgi:CRP-like cAMP-binding protein